jgi:hypothetical protein
MAARPNTTRTIAYGVRIARMQVARLTDAVAKAENAIATNALLTKEEIELYKSYIKLCNKQVRQFTDIASLEVPSAPKATKRKPGRPSFADLEAAAASRKGKVVAKPAKAAAKPAKATAAAKPAKAAVAAKAIKPTKAVAKVVKAAKVAKAPTVVLSTEPKRRGRPPKAKVEAATPAAAPVTAPKRRGRPPKAKVEAATVTATAAAVVVEAAAPKRRGRPPKAKPESVGTNGASTAVKLVAVDAPALGTMLSSENN